MTFVSAARPGAYLQVNRPGQIKEGDAVRVAHKPTHTVAIAVLFPARRTEPDPFPRLSAASEQPQKTRRTGVEARTFSIA